MHHRNFATSFILGSLLLALGCGGSGEGEPCSVADHTGCEKGMVCEEVAVPGASGGKNVSVPYAGLALKSGMIYQFRALSIKNGGSAISATEDLKGVFSYK